MMQARHALLVAVASVLAVASHCATSSTECTVAAPVTCGDDECVDLLNDPENCGGCARNCHDGNCARGLCQCGGTTCASGSICCGTACADLNSDPLHCGSCTNACPPELACIEGVCTGGGCDPGCTIGLTCCGRGCVDTRISAANCGRCGRACPTGQICESGACTVSACSPPCTTPERCCVDRCVDITTDPNNCNFCGNRCLDDVPPLADSCVKPASGPAHCSCHGSADKCRPGQLCCPDGCRSVASDKNNCGACGNVCDPVLTDACVAGSCVCGDTGGSCPAGTSCCSGACIDTSDDMEHCGSCTNVCNLELADACVGGLCKCGSSAVCTRPTAFCESPVGVLYQKCCAATCVTLGTDTDCAECGAACDTTAGEYCSSPTPWPPCNFTCGGV